MSEGKAAFEKAAQEAQGLRRKPSNDMLLRLYALYNPACVSEKYTVSSIDCKPQLHYNFQLS